tara:strand:- start:2282 stop:3352 length:1071 start_codon:yes stop_codon:yes gene_type:complete
MEFINYKNILELIPNENNNKLCNNSLNDESLYHSIEEFINKHNISNILISLSGGVDSMVLTEIFYKIREKNENIFIYCSHINYNNRTESIDEKKFLIDYCKVKNITLNCLDIDIKRGDIKRNLYEKQTRNMRFEYYNELCKLYNCPGVFLAHHEDDLCENIFNNIMRGGKEITDLCAFKKINNILNVTIFRPMMDYRKDVILNIADKYQIPYFLDTTPDWSCRGKMRRKIFPNCEDCYSEKYKDNLLKLGNESEELNHIINTYIIDELFDKSFIYNVNDFIIKKEHCLKESYIFKLLMKRICHFLNIECMKYKHIVSLTQYITNNNTYIIKSNILKGYHIHIDNEKFKFIKNEIYI